MKGPLKITLIALGAVALGWKKKPINPDLEAAYQKFRGKFPVH